MSSKSFTSYHSLHLFLQEDIISDTTSSPTSKQHYNLIKTTSSTMTVQAASMSLGTHYPKEICGWSLNQLGKMGKKQSRQYKIFMQRGERTDQIAPA